MAMGALVENAPVLLRGFETTLLLTVVATALAFPLGLALAAMRVAPAAGLRLVGSVYVAVLRNVPLTVVFFFSAFVLPQLGVRQTYLVFALIALVAYYAAFFCEAVRAGINAVPAGQAEAARSIGLGFWGVLIEVVLPQALRTAVPPLINVVIALVKSTAVASAFGVAEMLSAMEQVANLESSAVISVLVATGLLYIAITVPLGLAAGSVERRLRFAR